MTATIARVAYHSTVREMPSDERPRERLEHYGAASLQTAELLAIILRVGTAQENVIELSSRLLRQYGGPRGPPAGGFPGACPAPRAPPPTPPQHHTARPHCR